MQRQQPRWKQGLTQVRCEHDKKNNLWTLGTHRKKQNQLCFSAFISINEVVAEFRCEICQVVRPCNNNRFCSPFLGIFFNTAFDTPSTFSNLCRFSLKNFSRKKIFSSQLFWMSLSLPLHKLCERNNSHPHHAPLVKTHQMHCRDHGIIFRVDIVRSCFNQTNVYGWRERCNILY